MMTEQESPSQNAIATDLLLYSLITTATMIAFTLLIYWRLRSIMPTIRRELHGNALQQMHDIASAPILNVVFVGLGFALVSILAFFLQTSVLHFCATKMQGGTNATLKDLFAHSTLFHASINVAMLALALVFGFAVTVLRLQEMSFGFLLSATVLLILAISPFSFKFVAMPFLMTYYVFKEEFPIALVLIALIGIGIGIAAFYFGAKILKRIYNFEWMNAFNCYFQEQFYYGMGAGVILVGLFLVFSIVVTR